MCLCVGELFISLKINFLAECGATCFWVTKNSCKHGAEEAASRSVAVCLYFRDGSAI